MPFLHSPRFPTINRSPTAGAIIRNFDFADWAWVVCFSTGFGILGFIGGKPLRRPGFWFMGGFGVVMSMCAGYRLNEYKLLGYYPNEAECRAAGIEFKVSRGPIGLEP